MILIYLYLLKIVYNFIDIIIKLVCWYDDCNNYVLEITKVCKMLHTLK